MAETEYVIPWVQMRAKREYILKASKQYPVVRELSKRIQRV